MFQVRNEKNIKNFKNTFGVELKEDQIKLLDRYYAIKNSNQKARWGMQDKILNDLYKQIKEIYDKKRLNQRMRKEKLSFSLELSLLFNCRKLRVYKPL